jgi:hypothetical protein
MLCIVHIKKYENKRSLEFFAKIVVNIKVVAFPDFAIKYNNNKDEKRKRNQDYQGGGTKV